MHTTNIRRYTHNNDLSALITHRSAMSAEKLRKIKKQPKNTWFTLHKRLIGLPDPLETIFDPDVATFVDLKAKSLSTNRGYLASCIITTTAFIASTICTIESFGATFPINMYSIFMGPPTSGKSQAIKDCNTSPVENLAEEFNWGGVIISKCTSSALSKCLSSLKMGFMMSSEIFDVFHKLLKSDEDTASGDTQLLCQLFTGEKCTFRYATERTREIPANTPFSLLGATQVPYAAQLICQLDQGNGLLERLLLTAPSCLRPTVAVTQEATEELSNYRVATFTDIFIQMRRILTQTTFTFSDDATLTLQEINDDFIAQVNDAITNGRPTPTSKVFDLVQRVAVSLHIFNYIAVSMLHGNEVAPPREVQAQTLERAMKYVHWANEQKEVFVEYIATLLQPILDDETPQPCIEDIKRRCLLLPGPIISFRTFKQCTSKKLRGIAEDEFFRSIAELEQYGAIVQIRAPRATDPTTLFIKKRPEAIDWHGGICQEEKYRHKYTKPTHPTITAAMKDILVRDGHVTVDIFE